MDAIRSTALVSAGCFTAAVTPAVFVAQPDRFQRCDVTVMQQITIDELSHIQALWPSSSGSSDCADARCTRRSTLVRTCTRRALPLQADDRPAERILNWS